METLLMITILSLCNSYTPDQTSSGCSDATDYMVNCVIESDKKLEEKKINECVNDFKKGRRYTE